MDKQAYDKLIEKAKFFAQNAYCPYSDNPIGCCVLTQNGMIYGGCNIELVSLNNSLGAVEVAVSKAVSEGALQIMAVAIYSENIMPYPTGAERQLIKEFNNRTQVIVASKDEVEQLNIQELLPFSREK